jgi:hypothetical protein
VAATAAAVAVVVVIRIVGNVEVVEYSGVQAMQVGKEKGEKHLVGREGEVEVHKLLVSDDLYHDQLWILA